MNRMQRAALAALVGSALVATASAATPAASLEEARQYEWFRILEKAKSDYHFKCAGQGDDAACAAEISGIEQAIAASDATPSVQHSLAQQVLDAMQVRGNNLLERREYAQADTVLSNALATMNAHNENGKHGHVQVDSLALIRDVALLRIEQKRWGDVAEMTQMVRPLEGLWDDRAQVGDNERFKDMLEKTVVGSERFETAVADALFEMSKRDASAKTQLLQDAYVAYGRAADWTLRANEIGVSAFAASRADVRWALLKVGQGRAARDLGNTDDARALFAEAINMACREPDAGGPRRNKADDEELAGVCEHASSVDYVLSPEFNAAFDSWYDQQLKAMGGD